MATTTARASTGPAASDGTRAIHSPCTARRMGQEPSLGQAIAPRARSAGRAGLAARAVPHALARRTWANAPLQDNQR